VVDRDEKIIAEARDLAVRFDLRDTPVFEEVGFAVARGELLTIVGASGVGKSTLLRELADLYPPTAGSVHLRTTIDATRRAVAMVFEDARLMPWRRVGANVRLGLEGLALDYAERADRIRNALALVGLEDLVDRWPHQLSGGQRQRIGIARALAVRPDLLLMDEPFGSLDAITRGQLQDELLRIWRETSTSIVLVTHDIDEAVYLGSRVVVLGGRPARISHEFDAVGSTRRDSGPFTHRVRQVKAGLFAALDEAG
jgi:NitT/TauT family transport system ATP-binding protein